MATLSISELTTYEKNNLEKFNKLRENISKNLANISETIGSKPYLHCKMQDIINTIETNIKNTKLEEIYILEIVNNQLNELIQIDDKPKLYNETVSIYNFLNNYRDIDSKVINYIKVSWDNAFKNIHHEISKFGELNDILKNHKTYEIYKKSEDGNHKKYKFYIYWAIGLAVVGFILSIFSKVVFTKCLFGELCFLEYNNIDYWIMKASIIFITITGITFCLKQAIHHQKKKDRAEQTRLELEALPTYMFNFSDEQKNQVYTELTSKYFGRDFDKDGYQDMSNLVQEQIKLSHEVLKTTISNQKTGNQSKPN